MTARKFQQPEEGPTVRFSIYDRFFIEIERVSGRWRAFRPGDGTRRPEPDLVIPPDVDAASLQRFLEDVYHEYARPGHSVRRLDHSC